MKYTLEDLKEINVSYDREHVLTESDVEQVNAMIEIIENTRNEKAPQIGDAIQYTSQYGEYSAHAHVDGFIDGKLNICARPYTPILTESNNGTAFSCRGTSGGEWANIPTQIEYVGTTEKVFSILGHSGLCANGAVRFFATVNVWRYSDCEGEYTTEFYDKYYVNVADEPKSPFEYKYLVSSSGLSRCAFRTDEEYQKWLEKVHGVELPGAWPNMRILWTYKLNTLYVPLDEYLETEGLIDAELMNGDLQQCKRIVEGTSITTIFPYQHERILVDKNKSESVGVK